jgi:hypothetical protein
MDEIAPSLWHWKAVRERIGAEVSSYYLQSERVVVDPMIPPQGLEFFEVHGAPEHAVLTNRHHDRDAWRLQDAYGTTVHCIRNGLHEIEGRGAVAAFDFGDELPGEIHVREVDAICPDETALYIPRHRALAVADGVVRWRGDDELQFVPDSLMDDPVQTKRQLRAAYRRLLELEFELLLLAHGDPITTDARRALQAFLETPG